MDAFEIRMQFVSVIRRLNSSQQSIQKVVAFAIKHAPRSSDDIWDCLVEECEKSSINARINIFFAIDSLLDAALNSGITSYLESTKRDLGKLVGLVVPREREGILNLMSAKQILKVWKTKRMIAPEIVEPVERALDSRNARASASQGEAAAFHKFSHNDVLRRIEDDRERHKRLREKIWVLPLPRQIEPLRRLASALPTAQALPVSPTSPAQPATPGPAPPKMVNSSGQSAALAIDIELDQLWDQLEPLGEEDHGIMSLETARAIASR
ncbi:uncharacterized protein L969DRAFT_105119 [Mixia osmundae IAM 14324]|uniref:CID domain-containing protein n=1 Tax=Mixia osmundae (strain CBS 9802 / IAM 14324 / JCM 22182 / KY 12970) TaxID=764103 RepID=G7DWG1_MIXOS|nr:uncharacterized protein L969DRAFT_105119 [Mixia osmundae IAM 14324]KEI37323.1 hypothetical protein L969DRAFT_105119 [Mixia osmundae IAM 14324]GAA94921.1 hypothetical protein E5Q_01576 [Mixia osmundae IAM 14324]